MAGSIISVINQKGGVGKTTTVINLATALAKKGMEILVIDLDPQGNATTGLGKSNNDEEKSIYNVLIGKTSLKSAIQKTNVPGLDIIGSNVNLSGLEVETANDMNRAFLLKEILLNKSDLTLNKYETIFIDCPPSLGLLTVNAFSASHSVLVPLQCEFYALEGLAQLLRSIELVKKNLNPSLTIQGIVLTMFDSRNNLSEMVVNDVRKHFGKQVYKTIIPRNVRISEAPSFGQPVLMYDINCSGSKAYTSLAAELLQQENVNL